MRRVRLFLVFLVVLVSSIGLSFLVVRAEPPPTTVLNVVELKQGGIPSIVAKQPSITPPIPPPAPKGITIYLNRTLFIEEYPSIPFEDFGGSSTVGCPALTGFLAPLNALSNNDCFSPGDIVTGLELRDNPLNGDGGANQEGLVFAPAGAAGVSNDAVTGNHLTNTFEIILTPTATVVGLDMVTLFGADPLRIRLYGAGTDDELLYETTLPSVGPAGFFMGFETAKPIRRIELFAAEGTLTGASEGLSGIFFGSPIDEISLDLTVGTNAHACATTDAITVLPNTEVTYCYRFTNNTPLTLSTHTLTDTVFGTIREQDGIEVAPGASLVLTASSTPLNDDSNTATWTTLAPLDYTLGTGSCGVFPDITTTGQPLNLDDDDYTDVSLPIPFRFYDIITSKILVSNNGIIIVQETDEDLPTVENVTFPTDVMRRIIAPFWDDLNNDIGNVYVGPYTFNSTLQGPNTLLAPLGTTNGATTYFAIEWFDRPHVDGSDDNGVTFTTLLAYPGQGMDGYMVTCYADTDFGDPLLDFGASATIGINQFDSNADLFSYNTAQPVLTDAYGVGYSAINPGNYGVTDTATVTVFNPNMNVEPTSLSASHSPAPQTTALTLTLTNTGDDLLIWELYESFNLCGSATPVSWLTPDTVGGILPRGRFVTITTTFDSAALPDGTYTAALCITSDDPNDGVTVVPVDFIVAGSPVELIQLYLPLVRRR